MIKVLGFIDLLIAITSILAFFNLYNKNIVVIAGIYLILKGLLFFSSFISILDGVSGALLLVGTIIPLPPGVYLVICLFLLQKGVFSFL